MNVDSFCWKPLARFGLCLWSPWFPDWQTTLVTAMIAVYSNADHVAPATGDGFMRGVLSTAHRTRLTCVPGYPLPA